MDNTTSPSQPEPEPEAAADGSIEPPAEGAPHWASTGCIVELNLLTADCDPPACGWIEDQLTRVAAAAEINQGRLSLAMVDDLEMARLHERYTGIAGTTDVLTFDLRDRPGDPLEADILVCRDEAIRQAEVRGHAVRLELLLYAVHGLLHLLGHDDHDPQAAAEMHRREDELLAAAGLGSVYAAAATR